MLLRVYKNTEFVLYYFDCCILYILSLSLNEHPVLRINSFVSVFLHHGIGILMNIIKLLEVLISIIRALLYHS